MATQKLTDRFIQGVPAPKDKNREEYFDETVRGLSLRVSSKGTKVWHFKTKVKGGKRPGYTLGRYPDMPLKEARSKALEINSQAKKGVDVREEERAAKRKADADAVTAQTVRQVLDLYYTNHIGPNLKPRSGKERKAQLEAALGRLLHARLDQITPKQLQEIIDSKQGEGKMHMANRLRSALKAFTKWAADRDYLETDIGARLQKAGRERPRERTPSLEEIRDIWRATFSMGPLWGPFFRLCLLTAQRNRSDIIEMKWSWIDFSNARYEVPNPKNGRPHIVPLSKQAIRELKEHRSSLEARALGGGGRRHDPVLGDYVFTTTGHTPAQAVSRAKDRLDQAVSLCRAQREIAEPMTPWVLHDIRRSFATSMADNDVPEGVVDRIMNHTAVSSRPSISSSVYQKSNMLPARRKALQDWADLLTAGEEATVCHATESPALASG